MPNNSYTITISLTTSKNLQNWAALQNKTLEEAAEVAIRKFLEHAFFYEEPKKELQFYLTEGKIRIYRVLQVAGLTIGQIAGRTHKSWNATKAILDDLELAGVVIQKRFGSRVRFYQLNRENLLYQRILEILDLWYES